LLVLKVYVDAAIAWLRPSSEWIAVLKFFSGSAFGALVEGYKAKLASDNTADKIAADLATKDLELQGRERELNVKQNISDEGRWWTAAPRAIVCWSIALFIAKAVCGTRF